MLVKYNGNADKSEGTAVIGGTEAGYDIPIGGVGELTDREYAVLSTRLSLEVVGDNWGDLKKDELEEHAMRLQVNLEGLSTKDEYAKAIKDNRQTSEEDGEPLHEPLLPATATASPASPVVAGAGGAAGPEGSGGGPAPSTTSGNQPGTATGGGRP